MKLQYKAADKNGKIIKGVIEAGDVNEVVNFLREKGLLPIGIEKEDKGFSSSFPMFNKAGSKDVVLFTRQLSSMLSSGLTLAKSVQIFRDQVQNPTMLEVVNGIIADIEEGKPFSSSISKYPKIFTPIYISLVKAGESSGLLDKVLLRLADNLEKEAKLRSTVKSAFTYPAIVVVLMVGVVIIMMIFVIPQLSLLYTNLNVPLPASTKIVVGFSSFLGTFWPLVIAFGFLANFFFSRWKKTEEGRLIIDSFVLKLPVFGKLQRETILTEFTRTLGLLIGTGTLVVESLIETSDTTGNIHYRNAIKGVANQVEKGVKIGDAMATYPLFPTMIVQLVKIGEETGKLDETLGKASEYFETQVNETVKTLTASLEPFIMVVLGVGVAFLIMSVITPIYSLISSIQ